MSVHDRSHGGPMAIDPQMKAVRRVHHAFALKQLEIVVHQHEASAAAVASCSRARIGAGVPAGANRAYELSATSCGKPASVVVGISGMMALRRALVTASARSEP